MTYMIEEPPKKILPINTQKFPALCLNGDYTPLSYYPLSLWSFEETAKKVYEGVVQIVATYDEWTNYGANNPVKIPSVVVLNDYKPMPRHVPFTRYNVFLRDEFTCQYCNERFNPSELTFEHVIPRSQGGDTTWENIVAACEPCNTKKDARTPKQAGMILRSVPKEPSAWTLRDKAKKFSPKVLHKTWIDYVYWGSELEK